MRILDEVLAALPPIYVIHFVTHRCNLACEFCCDGHNRRRRPELTLEQIRKLYGSLIAAQLTITGGEPSLRDDLDEILIAALRARVHSVSLNTNGLRADRLEAMICRALEAASSPKLKVNVSIDGCRETHDRMRRLAGSYDAAVDCLERLTRLKARFRGLDLRVNTVVTGDNVDEVAGFRTFVKERLPSLSDHVFSLHRTPPGGTVDPRVLAVYRQVTSEHVADDSRGIARPLLRRLHVRMYEEIGDLAEGLDTGFRCPAGGGLVEILAGGDVVGCEVLPRERALLGNLAETDYELAPVLRGAAARAFRERIAAEGCACSFECAHLTAAALRFPRLLLPRPTRRAAAAAE